MVKESTLAHISPSLIEKNPENPKMVFREDELSALQESIAEVGIKVPLSVYREGENKYVLLDGERRWRCSKKLNLKNVPLIIQPKPSKLENLLMMFNIHNVRVNWDPMPMALKLADIKKLLEKEGEPTNIKELAAVTGLSPSAVKRLQDLLSLPEKYQKMLLTEAKKPRSKQEYTADLFIEIFKSLHAIERHVPEVLESIDKSTYIDSMVDKYIGGIERNVVNFRNISKIARYESAQITKNIAVNELIKLVKKEKYSIDDAYKNTVSQNYEQKDMLSKVSSMIEKLKLFKPGDAGEELIESFKRLKKEINRIIK